MIHSTEVSSMMLHIDWTQVRGLKDHLARQGFISTSEILVMTLYKGTDPVRTKIKFEQLQSFLFECEGDPKLIGIYVLDAKSNKPLWSAKAAERGESLESIPTSGHASVVIEFKDMTPEQKQIWIDMMTSATQSYVDRGEV
jgi:hypothetical protein